MMGFEDKCHEGLVTEFSNHLLLEHIDEAILQITNNMIDGDKRNATIYEETNNS